MTLTLTLIGTTALYLYVVALAHRIGIGRRPHARVWSRPRPARLRAHGAHEAAPAPAPVKAGKAGKAVAT